MTLLILLIAHLWRVEEAPTCDKVSVQDVGNLVIRVVGCEVPQSTDHWVQEGLPLKSMEFQLIEVTNNFRLCSNNQMIKYFQNFHLILYLLQMTTFGKVARPIGSVDEINLVDTVDVVNCFTVLKQKQDEIYQNCATRICGLITLTNNSWPCKSYGSNFTFCTCCKERLQDLP